MSRSPVIPLSEPSFDGNERRYLQACIDEGWVASKGRFVREFETLFAERHGRSVAVSTSSGTAALHLAMVELGIGPGDEVAVPGLTFVASATPVRHCGATPVLIDVDPETYTMDPADLEAAISPSTRAIVVVHLYGQPADMDAIEEVAARHGLPVIEDATEALGSSYRGRPCGTLGDLAAFSFNGNKVITSGGGGMVLASDARRLEHIRHLSLQARVPGTLEYVHDEVGFNYALTNLQAAVGLAQLERLDVRLAARRRLWERYAAAGLEGLCREAPWGSHNFWLMSVLVDDRERVAAHLAAAGIQSRPFFTPLGRLPPFAEGARPTPVADDLHRHGVSIPSSSAMTDAEQDRVIEALLNL